MNEFWIFVTGVIVLLGAPGPTNALLAVGGSQRGLLRCLPLLGAELLGYSLAIAVIRLVLQPVLSQFPILSLVFKLAFAAFALSIAIKLWRQAAKPTSDSGPITFWSMFVATFLNPKAFGFALVLIPFSSPQITVYCAIFAGLVLFTGGSWVAAGVIATRIGGNRAQTIVARTGSLVMALFALFIFAYAIGG